MLFGQTAKTIGFVVGVAAMAAFVATQQRCEDRSEFDERLIPELILALQDPTAEARADAAKCLMHRGASAISALTPLLNALNDESATVCANAAVALFRLGPLAVPALVRRLEHEKILVRQGAASALAMFGPAAEPGAESLVRRLGDTHRGVRYQAARALAGIGPTVEPLLLEAMRGAQGEMREAVAEALSQIPELSAAALPVALGLLHDPDQLVREFASVMLMHME